MQFPRNMKFARAMSNGVGLHCPDLTAGTPVYTPDELGGEEPDGDVAPEPEPVGEEPGETLVVLEAAGRTAHERLVDVAVECGYTAATLSCAGSSATGTTSSS